MKKQVTGERALQILQKPSTKLPASVISQTPSGKLAVPFTLHWSYYEEDAR
jgi:hypothetical protein